MYQRFKKTVFNMLNQTGTPANTIYRVCMLLLVAASALLLATGTVDNIVHAPFKHVLYYIETTVIGVFTLEYVARIWTADLCYPRLPAMWARLVVLFRPMSVVDLLAIFPYYISLVHPLPFAMLFGAFRILKAVRYVHSLQKITRVIYLKRQEILLSMGVLITLIFLSALLIYQVEHAAQPDKFDNVFSAMWWSVMTLTTVGYGDICPITAAGKLLGSAMSLMGIGLVAIPTGIISAGFIELNDGKIKYRSYCPYCGKKIEYEENIRHDKK